MRWSPWLVRLLVRVRLARFFSSLRRLGGGQTAALGYYSSELLGCSSHEMEALEANAESCAHDGIDLSLESPRFDILGTATAKLPADLRGEPPTTGLPELREMVARLHGRACGVWTSPADEVLVAAGTGGALRLALDALADRRDGVALFAPFPPEYRLAAAARQLRLIPVPAESRAGRLCFSMSLLVRALRRAKLLIIQSPANPTGAVLAPEDVEQIAWWCDKYDTLILNDESYVAYRYDDTDLHLAGMPRAARRTLTVGSVGQSHSLSAYGVGWLVGPRQLVRPCRLVARWRSEKVPTLCQQLALSALRLPQETMDGIRAEFRGRRQYAFERLQATGLEPCWPGGGYFLWLPIGRLNLSDRTFVQRLLREKRVRVTAGSEFGPGGAGHVRISLAIEDGRLGEGLRRLADFVRGLAPLADAA